MTVEYVLSKTNYRQSDYDNFDNEFNFDLPLKKKRGASQYYLLHFGMPGASRRAPKPQRSYQLGVSTVMT